jgi:hypothetical protein
MMQEETWFKGVSLGHGSDLHYLCQRPCDGVMSIDSRIKCVFKEVEEETIPVYLMAQHR